MIVLPLIHSILQEQDGDSLLANEFGIDLHQETLNPGQLNPNATKLVVSMPNFKQGRAVKIQLGRKA